MFGVGQQGVIWGDAICLGVFRRHGLIDELECQLCRGPNARLHLCRSQSRDLNQNAVFAVCSALGLNRRLGGSCRVNPPSNNFNRSCDAVLDPALYPCLGRLDRNNTILSRNRQIEARTRAAARQKRCGQRLCELLQPCKRNIHLVRIAERHTHLIPCNYNAGMSDFFFAQRAARIGLKRLQPIFFELHRIYLIKKMSAAPKIKAKRHTRKLRPLR